MNAEAALYQSYDNWRRLAEIEGEGIRQGNWSLVADCQKALQLLQPQLLRESQAARNQWQALGANLADKEKSVRAVVSRLIAIEWRNQRLLADRRQKVTDQLNRCHQSRAHLQGIRRSYSTQPQPSWTSLS